VVDVDTLASLDGVLWLRSGAIASKRLGQHQSTISRNINRCEAVFGVKASKNNGEWHLKGDASLLNLERVVHQRHRWLGGRCLRIEALHWSAKTYLEPTPEGWLPGNHDLLNVQQPLNLLRDCILDAWIGAYPDVPDQDDPDFASFPLLRHPLSLVVGENHPLLTARDGLTFEMVSQYPSLALPDGAFPQLEDCLKRIGLWNSPSGISRYNRAKWEGRWQSELLIGYASIFSIRFYPQPQYFLPLQLPLMVGDNLVVKREFENHPRLLNLLADLRQRLNPWLEAHPNLIGFGIEADGGGPGISVPLAGSPLH
jgi:DNA-binding transcriptional LysR family regulator